MASVLYASCLDDTVKGAINFNSDTFKVMLLTATYTPAGTTHLKRSDLTNEVVGTGYTAGGNAATVAPTKDTVNGREDISLGGTAWPTSTITARYAAYYKARGGAASADELVALIDFGSNITSSAATFTLAASTLRLTNSNP